MSNKMDGQDIEYGFEPSTQVFDSKRIRRGERFLADVAQKVAAKTATLQDYGISEMEPDGDGDLVAKVSDKEKLKSRYDAFRAIEIARGKELEKERDSQIETVRSKIPDPVPVPAASSALSDHDEDEGPDQDEFFDFEDETKLDQHADLGLPPSTTVTPSSTFTFVDSNSTSSSPPRSTPITSPSTSSLGEIDSDTESLDSTVDDTQTNNDLTPEKIQVFLELSPGVDHKYYRDNPDEEMGRYTPSGFSKLLKKYDARHNASQETVALVEKANREVASILEDFSGEALEAQLKIHNTRMLRRITRTNESFARTLHSSITPPPPPLPKPPVMGRQTNVDDTQTNDDLTPEKIKAFQDIRVDKSVIDPFFSDNPDKEMIAFIFTGSGYPEFLKKYAARDGASSETVARTEAANARAVEIMNGITDPKKSPQQIVTELEEHDREMSSQIESTNQSFATSLKPPSIISSESSDSSIESSLLPPPPARPIDNTQTDEDLTPEKIADFLDSDLEADPEHYSENPYKEMGARTPPGLPVIFKTYEARDDARPETIALVNEANDRVATILRETAPTELRQALEQHYEEMKGKVESINNSFGKWTRYYERNQNKEMRYTVRDGDKDFVRTYDARSDARPYTKDVIVKRANDRVDFILRTTHPDKLEAKLEQHNAEMDETIRARNSNYAAFKNNDIDWMQKSARWVRETVWDNGVAANVSGTRLADTANAAGIGTKLAYRRFLGGEITDVKRTMSYFAGKVANSRPVNLIPNSLGLRKPGMNVTDTFVRRIANSSDDKTLKQTQRDLQLKNLASITKQAQERQKKLNALKAQQQEVMQTYKPLDPTRWKALAKLKKRKRAIGKISGIEGYRQQSSDFRHALKDHVKARTTHFTPETAAWIAAARAEIPLKSFYPSVDGIKMLAQNAPIEEKRNLRGQLYTPDFRAKIHLSNNHGNEADPNDRGNKDVWLETVTSKIKADGFVPTPDDIIDAHNRIEAMEPGPDVPKKIYLTNKPGNPALQKAYDKAIELGMTVEGFKPRNKALQGTMNVVSKTADIGVVTFRVASYLTGASYVADRFGKSNALNNAMSPIRRPGLSVTDTLIRKVAKGSARASELKQDQYKLQLDNLTKITEEAHGRQSKLNEVSERQITAYSDALKSGLSSKKTTKKLKPLESEKSAIGKVSDVEGMWRLPSDLRREIKNGTPKIESPRPPLPALSAQEATLVAAAKAEVTLKGFVPTKDQIGLLTAHLERGNEKEFLGKIHLPNDPNHEDNWLALVTAKIKVDGFVPRQEGILKAKEALEANRGPEQAGEPVAFYIQNKPDNEAFEAAWITAVRNKMKVYGFEPKQKNIQALCDEVAREYGATLRNENPEFNQCHKGAKIVDAKEFAKVDGTVFYIDEKHAYVLERMAEGSGQKARGTVLKIDKKLQEKYNLSPKLGEPIDATLGVKQEKTTKRSWILGK